RSQRLAAAFFAISARFSLERFLARAAPPLLPSSAAALRVRSISSGSSPVAILATRMALPITSAGRFSPLGPFGIALPLEGYPKGNGDTDDYTNCCASHRFLCGLCFPL